MGEYDGEHGRNVLAGISYVTLLVAGAVNIILGILERNPALATSGVMMFLPGAGATAYLYKNKEPISI